MTTVTAQRSSKSDRDGQADWGELHGVFSSLPVPQQYSFGTRQGVSQCWNAALTRTARLCVLASIGVWRHRKSSDRVACHHGEGPSVLHYFDVEGSLDILASIFHCASRCLTRWPEGLYDIFVMCGLYVFLSLCHRATLYLTNSLKVSHDIHVRCDMTLM